MKMNANVVLLVSFFLVSSASVRALRAFCVAVSPLFSKKG
jgi:hypothetical protein